MSLAEHTTAPFTISNIKHCRPQYTPWLAALLTHPAHRSKGVATRMMNKLESLARTNGIPALYLGADPVMRPFYEAHGWTCIEEQVEDVDIYEKALA